MSTNGPLLRYLGGEAAHRNFFGGRGDARVRWIVVGVVVVGGLVMTPLMGWPALAVTLAVVSAVLILTARTHNGSILERRRRRSRWRGRQRLGTDRFEPYDATRWENLEAAATTGPRRHRAAAVRDRNAMRAMPDGADGMGWLQTRVGAPGIAWHAPVGVDPYLSVAYAVAGQIRGVESSTKLAQGGEAWGRFLADRAAMGSLVGTVQAMTRVLPPETAQHEAWALDHVAPDAPGEAVESYAEVIQRAGQDAMIQRHYVIVTWPLTAEFTEQAAKYAPGRDGWRELMTREIDAVGRGLRAAGLGGGRQDVEPLTARQTVALMLHQQNPTRPVDAVRSVDPARPGLRSHDVYAAHVVEATDYTTGSDVEWWHRTAAITADGLSTGPRTQLWVLPLLIGVHLRFIRSVSFHMRLIPARHAKARARADLTADQSALIAHRRKGRLANDETKALATAASHRVADLSDGSPHHGIEWVGYVTVTARSLDELRRSCRQLEEVLATGLGIERVTWQDSYQGAASGTTWPIGRGLRPTRDAVAARVYGRLAGSGDKEAL